MKAKTAIYLHNGDIIKTPMSLMDTLKAMDRVTPNNNTLRIERLNDQGKIKQCFIPSPTIIRVEQA